MVKKWIGNNGIQLLDWPAQSPDLNPIENLWREVERRLAGQKYQKPHELFHAVQQIWESLSHELIKKLIESMTRRCAAVIKAKGFSTK